MYFMGVHDKRMRAYFVQRGEVVLFHPLIFTSACTLLRVKVAYPGKDICPRFRRDPLEEGKRRAFVAISETLRGPL